MRIHLIRLLTFVVSVAMVALVGAVGTATTASAQPPGQVKKQNTVDVTGFNRDTGQQVFTGTFTATGPARENAGNSEYPLLVTGELQGKLEGAGQRGQGQGPPSGQGEGISPVKQQVEWPAAATAEQATGPAAGESVQPACQVLRLVLGPLDLNLLGLRIQLNRVVLLITAIPGGGLLGDLLCALAGGPVGVTQLNPILRAL